MKQLLQLGTMAVHASNDEDPYVTLKDEQDDDSETENHAILPTDNLIAVGHVEGEAAILEVYGMCVNACMRVVCVYEYANDEIPGRRLPGHCRKI